MRLSQHLMKISIRTFLKRIVQLVHVSYMIQQLAQHHIPTLT